MRSTAASVALVALPAYVLRRGGGAGTLSRVLFAEMALAAVIALPRATAVHRFGERAVLSVASIIETLALAAIAGPSLLWAGAGRLVQGLADRTHFSVSTKVLFDVTDGQNTRARVRGAFSTAQSIGNLVGPALGGLLATLSLGLAVLGGTLLSAVNIVLVLGLLTLPRRPASEVKQSASLRDLFTVHMHRLLENRFLFLASLISALLSLFDIFTTAILEVHLLSYQGLSVGQLGLLLSVSSLVPILLTLPIATVVDRLGRTVPLIAAGVLIGASVWGFSLRGLPFVADIVLMAGLLLGLSFANSAWTTLYGDLTRPAVRMSEMEAVGTIRTIVGAGLALVVGRFYDSVPGLTVQAIAVVLAMGTLLLIGLDRWFQGALADTRSVLSKPGPPL